MHPLFKILKNRPIKRGANAMIWHAQDVVLDREVALKELHGWASRPSRARAAFQFAHIRRLKLHHPGLAEVHGADCDRGWIVLDYHASSLADLADPLAADEVRRILGEVATTLEYLHEQGFVHGAVKPTNLFGTPGDPILLADGLGVQFDDVDGTPDVAALIPLDRRDGKHLAPECLYGRGELIGPPVDLYALGLTGLELLLGRGAFESLFPLVQAGVLRWDEWHGSDEVLRPVSELLPDLPEDFADLIDRLIRKDPAQRPSLSDALHVLAPSIPETPIPPEASLPPRIPPIREKVSVASVEPDPIVRTPQVPTPAARSSLGWMAGTMATGLGGIGLGFVVSLALPSRSEPVALPEPVVQIRAAEPVPGKAEMAQLAARVDRLQRERDAAHLASKQSVDQLTEQQAQTKRLLAEVAKSEQSVRSEKNRANTLASALKTAQEKSVALSAEKTRALKQIDQFAGDVQRLERKLAQAQKDIFDRNQSVATLGKQLKAALEEVTQLRSDNERITSARLVPLELIPVPGGLSTPLILSRLKQIGAKVEMDSSKPDAAILAVDFRGTKITDDHLALLSGLTSLRMVDLTSTEIGDAGLTHLARLSNLKTLLLYGTRVSDAGMVHLRGLTGLRTLYLSSTTVGDPGMVHIQSLTGLEALYLTNTRVGNAGLVRLKGMNQLRILHLCTGQVSDAGLVHLKDLPSLSTLHLSYTSVSDTGLGHIKGVKSLRELDLSFTRATPQGINDLKAALPKCKVQQ